jgi:pimeloyl-ACP methyl ester carboxylesterase
MSTFVLVHGSFFGGWCWERVADDLRARGHEVHTPTLTGAGDRHHLASLDVGLESHVRDIAETLRFARLDDVVLVGHSYGGMVITGVAGEASDRIRRLVYLDAFVPKQGQSAHDVLGWTRDAFAEAAASHPEGLVPPFPLAMLGVEDPGDVAWIGDRMTALPPATHTQPSTGLPAGVAATYVHCKAQPFFDDVAAGVRAEGWPVIEVAAGHLALVTDASLVGAALDEAAAS